MRSKSLLLKLVLALCIAPPTYSQQLEEIVVTGSYRTEGVTLPVIYLTQKADFLVMRSYVENDSRNILLREEEVMKTIDSLEKKANDNPSIELGILKVFEIDDEEIEYIEPFTLSDITLSSGYRADTSKAEIIIKTPIQEDDSSPEKVLKRIEDFIESVPVTGRATLIDDGEAALSVTDISQYRVPLLKALAEDTELIQSTLGENYNVSISGLEQPLLWRVIGPLKLAIFFAYKSEANPR